MRLGLVPRTTAQGGASHLLMLPGTLPYYSPENLSQTSSLHWRWSPSSMGEREERGRMGHGVCLSVGKTEGVSKYV